MESSRENSNTKTGGGEYVKSLEHQISKVKKRRSSAPAPAPPSIWTEGKNGRRMLYDEPVAGGRNPQGKNGRRMLYDVHDEPVDGGRNPRRNPRGKNSRRWMLLLLNLQVKQYYKSVSFTNCASSNIWIGFSL